MRILSSSKLSARNSDLSTGVETRLSFSYGKLLGWIQNKYLVFPFLITYRKIVSSWKRHKISAWHKQNLNVIKTIRNWKKEQKRLELKSMKVIEVRTKWNTKQIEGSLKITFLWHVFSKRWDITNNYETHFVAEDLKGRDLE